MDFHLCYALSYERARDKFRAAAAAAGATLASYRHPGECGPSGAMLAIDVAHLGDRRGARQLMVISGTHGQEGFAGSAAQIAWMAAREPVPAGIGVLMVHGLNPYGFAHGSRTNENNVDLNRNFVDHDAPYPENPGYAELHPFLVPDDWDQESTRRTEAALGRFRAEHGADALFDTLARGQYTHASGLMYGGCQREWSNRTLETIVREHLGTAEKVAFIDWHTGIGDYGSPFFLCFNEPEGELFEQAARWWGADRVKNQRPHGMARPQYQGLVFDGVRGFLKERPMCGAVIEFGTRGVKMRRVLRLDLWLRFKAAKDSEIYAMLRADMADAFAPFDQEWRDATIAHGRDITRQAVNGLREW